MKKLLMIGIITTAMIACSKEDVNLESNQNVVTPTATSIAGVGVNEDGFLSFDSENAFKDFISSHTESSNTSVTRSGSSGFLIDGFQSIANLQENVIAAIAQFDTTLIQNLNKGEYFDLGNGITFINSFGEESVDSSEIELISSDKSETRAVASNSFRSGYSVNSYAWKNNSIWQNFWDRIRGKNVERENYFDSNRRVKVRVFDVNYGFYASSGISIKMQRRKKFWFVRYWVSDHADKMVLDLINYMVNLS